MLFVLKRLLSTEMSTVELSQLPPSHAFGMGYNGARKLSSGNVASMVRDPSPSGQNEPEWV
jgi:hypothetical protein